MTSAPDGPPYRLGIDIGGTFTDLVLLREGAPPVVAKVLSTPHSFARGVLDGVRALLHGAGVAPSEVADLVHGTTVATNALLQRPVEQPLRPRQQVVLLAVRQRLLFPPRTPLTDREVRPPRKRAIDASRVDLRRGKRQISRGRGMHTIELGRERVDLSYLEQLAEAGQTEAMARVIGGWAAGGQVGEVGELAREVVASISESGLDSLSIYQGHPGEMSLPRAQELAAAVNRVRTLRTAPRT